MKKGTTDKRITIEENSFRVTKPQGKIKLVINDTL